MKARLYPAAAAALAAIVFTANSHADIEDRLQKTFEVAPGGTLRVEADRGSIEIKTADTAQVQVEVLRQVKLADRSQADKILKNHEITLPQEGDTVEVRAKFLSATRSIWNREQQYLQVHYTVTVPRKFNLNLNTAGGSITVPDITGKLTCKTAGGSLRLGRIEGPVNGQTAGGSINLAGGTEAATLHTAGGSIHVGETAGNLEAETAGGSIHIKKANGHVKAQTAGGSIELEAVSGKIHAQTSGGSVTATLAGQPKDDCELTTSAGNITLTLPGDAAVDVDAETSGGRVISDLPTTVQGELHRSSLKGKINGGGPRMHLRTSAGNVHIRKK
jgi:DUF4097 and DUF4098 domain-containing protein YvlB